MGPLTIAGITAGVNALGSFFKSIGQKKREQRQQNYQKELLDYQNNLALSNWNKENEYNSPSAQMQRYTEAGLNPNLVYGQSNASGSIGEYQPPSVTPVTDNMEIIGDSIGKVLPSYLDAESRVIANQTGNYNRDKAEYEAKYAFETLTRRIEAENTRLETLRLESYLDSKEAMDEAYVRGQSITDSDDRTTRYSEVRRRTRHREYLENKINMIKIEALSYANAISEKNILHDRELLSKLDRELQENQATMDFEHMKSGQIVEYILNLVSKVFGVSSQGFGLYQGYQSDRRSERETQAHEYNTYHRRNR